MGSLSRWLLVDYDCSGLFTIQARDDHPKREGFSDDDALVLVQRQAARGNVNAAKALEAHNKDAPLIRDLIEKRNP